MFIAISTRDGARRVVLCAEPAKWGRGGHKKKSKESSMCSHSSRRERYPMTRQRSWQAMLESVDHWPMASLTLRPLGESRD